MDKHTEELGNKLLVAIRENNELLRGSGYPGEDGREPKGTKEQPKNNGQSAPGQQFLRAKLYPSPQSQWYPEKKFYKSFKFWKWLAEMVGILSAVVYACIAFHQWKDANTNFKAGQRAWVGLNEKSTMTIVAGKPVSWNLSIKNFGNSPAVRFKLHTHLYPDHMPFNNTEQDFELVGEQIAVLSTDDIKGSDSTIFNGQVIQNADKGTSNVPDEFIEHIRSGGAQIIGGKLTYNDVFGDYHTTTFCRIYNGNPDMGTQGLTVCPYDPDKTD